MQNLITNELFSHTLRLHACLGIRNIIDLPSHLAEHIRDTHPVPLALPLQTVVERKLASEVTS